jgi:hypothetical protein
MYIGAPRSGGAIHYFKDQKSPICLYTSCEANETGASYPDKILDIWGCGIFLDIMKNGTYIGENSPTSYPNPDLDGNGYISFDEAYQRFYEWCSNRGIHPLKYDPFNLGKDTYLGNVYKK